MTRAILILYILVTSITLVYLGKSLSDTRSTLKASEDNLETLAEVIMHHEAVLKDHREAILIVIDKLDNLYM